MSKIAKLKNIVIQGLSSLAGLLYYRPLWICKLTLNPSRWCNHASYYPELKRKTFLRIYFEQVLQVIKYGFPNEFYFSYGFDVKNNEEISKYLHYGPFMKLRDKANISKHGSTAVLRNKFLFGMFCEYLGVDCGCNVGLLDNRTVYLPQTKKSISIAEFCKSFYGNYFVKLVNGECGGGIFTLLIDKDNLKIDGEKATVADIERLTSGGLFLIQKRVEQHPVMASLHMQSLNTMRLVTIRNRRTGQVDVFPSILRIGTGNSYVDNTSQGGVAVGIDFNTGKLKSEGFLKPQFGGRINCHPDSLIKFDEFQIPYLDEAVKQAKFLHSKLPDIHSIGWDVAIGPDGPVFIEGNDNWEINGPQICNGGLKELYFSYL